MKVTEDQINRARKCLNSIPSTLVPPPKSRKKKPERKAYYFKSRLFGEFYFVKRKFRRTIIISYKL